MKFLSGGKFNNILKKLDKSFFKESLQKVLDCLIIKRYRIKIVSSLKLKNNKFNIKIKKKDNIEQYFYLQIIRWNINWKRTLEY